MLVRYQNLRKKAVGELDLAIKNGDNKRRKELLKRIAKYDLKIASYGTLELDVSVISKNCCDVCRQYNIVTSIDQAIIDDVIPQKGCIRQGGCNCVYGFHPKYDESGSVIRRHQSTIRRSYNPNTRYGRRMWRKDFDERFSQLPPDEQKRINTNGTLILIVIIIIIFLIILFVSGEREAFRWLRHLH